MEIERKTILSRTLLEEDKIYLSDLSSMLERTVDFGIKLLEADFARGGNERDLPPVLFLKNLMGNIDAISVLVASSVLEPCNVLLRTALENFFSLAYLLEDNAGSGQRSMDFLVWDLVERKKWLKKGDINSIEHQVLVKKYKHDKRFKNSPVITMPLAQQDWNRIDLALEEEGYRETFHEFERTKKTRKRNPAWYSLSDGPGSLEELAGRLGYPVLYELLYRNFSISTHGNNIVVGKLSFPDGPQAMLEPLRNKTTAESIVSHSLNVCYLAFWSYVEKRVPFMAGAYNNWIAYAHPFSEKLSEEVIEKTKKEDQRRDTATTAVKP